MSDLVRLNTGPPSSVPVEVVQECCKHGTPFRYACEDCDDEDEDIILCPHGFDSSSECPDCVVVYSELSNEEESDCKILLDKCSLAGNYRESVERLLSSEGRTTDMKLMRELIQMHMDTLLKHRE